MKTAIFLSGNYVNPHSFLGGLFRGYLRICFKCMVIAGGLTCFLNTLGINIFGFQQFVFLRTLVVLGMFAYLFSTLLRIGTRYEVVLVVAIPFLSQFYQVALGREYLEGATSLIRLSPLILMAAAMLLRLSLQRWLFSRNEVFCAMGIIFISSVAYVSSLFLTSAGFTCFFLMGILIPLFYFYAGCVVKNTRFGVENLAFAITISLFILLIGSICTILVGLKVDVAVGAGSFVGTQNLGDFNSIYSYILLSWPFAFLTAKKLHWSILASLVGLTVFSVALGFSRTSAILTPFLLFVSLLSYLKYKGFRGVMFALISLLLIVMVAGALPLSEKIFFRWAQRFDVDHLSREEIRLSDFVQPFKSGDRAVETRFGIVEEGSRVFRLSPIMGNGWASFENLSEEGYSRPHNITMNILVETGVIGAAFFWFMIIRAICIMLSLLMCKRHVKLDLLVILGSFTIWILVGHTLGSSLYTASLTGFQVNAITGMLFVLYLRRDILKGLLSIQPGLRRL